MKTRNSNKLIIEESKTKNTITNNSVNKISNKENSKTFKNEDNEFVENKSDNNTIIKKSTILKKAKVYFSEIDNEFFLNCIACDCKCSDVPEFLNHICNKKQKKCYTKTPEESIGTETNLVIGPDGLWHCRICDKGYDKKNSLKKHEQAHLLTYTCEICGKGLKSTVNLREHMNIHSGARPYKCHLCPMAFARKWGLTSHIRSHTGDKRYACQHCGKKFINGAILKIHIRMVHTKEKPCQCELCGQHFYSNQLLKEHKKRHMNIRPYKCEYENCGKSFYDRKQLNRHYVSHSDEKPFECTFNNCSAKFARHKTLQAHLKIHSGIKDYICSICGKAFAMNYNLTSHMRSHANGKLKGRKEPLLKRQYRKKNKTSITDIYKNDELLIEIKEETDNTQQNELNQIYVSNEAQKYSNFDQQQIPNLNSNETFSIQNEIELKTEQLNNNMEHPDDKHFVMLYDNNTKNTVPSNTLTPVTVENKFINMSPNQIISDTIPNLNLSQTVLTRTGTDEQIREELVTIQNSISDIETMDQFTFHTNSMVQIYQIPN